MFNIKYLTLCITAVCLTGHVAQAKEMGVIDKGKGTLILNEGDVIKNSAASSVTAISAGKNDAYSVSGSGGITVDVSTSEGYLTGIFAVSGGRVDLGSGTRMFLNNSGQNLTYGINTNSEGQVNGKDMTLSVVAQGQASGINIASNGAVTLTGSNNKITVTTATEPDNSVRGISAMGQSNTLASLNAENLTIETNGTGIEAQHYSELTLTGSTVIKSALGGLEAKGAPYAPGAGAVINAEKIHVSTTASGSGSAGLYSLMGGRISVGAGSVVETENMHGLFATSDPGYTTPPQLTTIDYIGSDTRRNLIQVNGLSGVTSKGINTTVTLENTDIKTRSQNARTVGIRALSGGTVNARNVSVQSEDAGTGYTSVAAILSRGSGSKVSLSGDTYIDASRTDNQVALLADGDDSGIVVTDKAVIDGNVISQGNNAIVDMDLRHGSVFSGATDVVKADKENTWTGGGIRLNLTDSTWNMSGNSNLTSFTLNNGGIVNLNSRPGKRIAAGNTLTIEGDYNGAGGTVIFNTVLEGDDSATDKLVVRGNTSGTTYVRVNNTGGTGAQTLNGIELIHVDGTSDGEFVQNGRIVAGAYDYALGRGQGNDSGNWYLTSSKTPSVSVRNNNLRPEAGSYVAGIAAANTLFVSRLHERPAKMQVTGTDGEAETSMWMRHEGGHNRWRDGSGQLSTQSNRYVFQLGGDLAQWSHNDTDRWHLGIMGGYGNSHSNTRSARTGNRSEGRVNGYSTGIYATWYADDDSRNGAYLDGQVLYGWFNNQVKGDGLLSESFKSKGLTASLEVGYTREIGRFTGSQGSLNKWYVQPQAQVVRMGMKADEHREANGTRVTSEGDGNIRTRLGVRTWIQGHSKMDDGKSREFRPFVEASWLHNTRDFGVRMDGVVVQQDGVRNIGDFRAGVEGQITSGLNVWGNVGVQVGDRVYNDLAAVAGVRYTF
ncbi:MULTISPECIES: autotransporter outer membrane beta-barrel domain-containing protein [Escherichia]|uniref:autotransporter outer membrane beta-barrel domain-containing protein n=1 Tax=Escherichia TaxID=561 RepID=UPI00136BAE0B|nr:autotransporter outer membrane beta-barrel domain-containing protein [Escherichia sp. HH41S]HAV8854180.1 autotransporter outer membrane beta-barrel domain-containing protein [Escherichia coli]HAW2942114.1 autotransporter outer membrane beta-barrel domain-containing protein [Escherichia coli]HAW3089177.1 autotransporter outer membrane beta-barrel domain-containing protein [Escherichia coli]HAW3094240.1 autotransporter outer membrane beta-barrel domain-containing protein [Escherichia coli]HAW